MNVSVIYNVMSVLSVGFPRWKLRLDQETVDTPFTQILRERLHLCRFHIFLISREENPCLMTSRVLQEAPCTVRTKQNTPAGGCSTFFKETWRRLDDWKVLAASTTWRPPPVGTLLGEIALAQFGRWYAFKESLGLFTEKNDARELS